MLQNLNASVKSFVDAAGDLEAIRKELVEIADERGWLQNSPLPMTEIRAKLHQEVDAAAAAFSGSEAMAQAAAGHGLSRLLTLSAPVFTHGAQGVGGTARADMRGVICFLLGDVLKKNITAALTEAGVEAGPPAAERAGLIAALDARQHALEVEEEAHVSTAEEVGLFIPRRADVDPAIVLAYEA